MNACVCRPNGLTVSFWPGQNVRIETTQSRLEDFENQGVERQGREGWWESAPR